MELDFINLIISITKFLIMIGSLQNVGVLLCKSKIAMNSLICSDRSVMYWPITLKLRSHKQTSKPRRKLPTVLFVV